MNARRLRYEPRNANDDGLLVPPGYKPPTWINGRALRTVSGVVIGGAISINNRPAANADTLHLSPVVLSLDAERMQRALLDPRTAPKPPHPLVARARAYMHELRTDPKAARLLRARLYRALVEPVIRWL